MFFDRIRKRHLKTYSRKSNDQRELPKLRLPLDSLNLGNTETSIDISFASPTQSVQKLDPVHLDFVTSTPAAKNIKSLGGTKNLQNEANFSNILKNTSNHFPHSPQENNCTIQNISKNAVHILSKSSLNCHNKQSKINELQNILQNTIENTKSDVVCCDKSEVLPNTRNSSLPFKEKNDLINTILLEIKSPEYKLPELNKSALQKITIRKRKTVLNSEKFRQTLQIDDVPKKNVGFMDNCDIHELTNKTIELSHDITQKLFIKSGKWRRTIYEIRKSKLACEFCL